MSNSKYYYAVVKKNTGKLLLESGHLPIFWLESVAKERCDDFNGTIVKKVKIEDLESLFK